MIIGDFDFTALLTVNAIVGPVFLFSYIYFVYFVLLNMFLAIINYTYAQIATETWQTFQIQGLLGLLRKQKPAVARVDLKVIASMSTAAIHLYLASNRPFHPTTIPIAMEMSIRTSVKCSKTMWTTHRPKLRKRKFAERMNLIGLCDHLAWTRAKQVQYARDARRAVAARLPIEISFVGFSLLE